MVDGMCEVGGYEHECAWVKIFERLKKFDRLDLFRIYRPPRDYRLRTSPSFIEINKEYTNEPPEEEAKG
jgi:hypothetical protein